MCWVVDSFFFSFDKYKIFNYVVNCRKISETNVSHLNFKWHRDACNLDIQSSKRKG